MTMFIKLYRKGTNHHIATQWKHISLSSSYIVRFVRYCLASNDTINIFALFVQGLFRWIGVCVFFALGHLCSCCCCCYCFHHPLLHFVFEDPIVYHNSTQYQAHIEWKRIFNVNKYSLQDYKRLARTTIITTIWRRQHNGKKINCEEK